MTEPSPLTDRERILLRQTMGTRCEQARKLLGLSQRGLGRLMGRTGSWVREVERGEQYPPPYLIVSLAEATGEGISWFYGRVEHDLDAVALKLLDRVEALDKRRAPRQVGERLASAAADGSPASDAVFTQHR